MAWAQTGILAGLRIPPAEVASSLVQLRVQTGPLLLVPGHAAVGLALVAAPSLHGGGMGWVAAWVFLFHDPSRGLLEGQKVVVVDRDDCGHSTAASILDLFHSSLNEKKHVATFNSPSKLPLPLIIDTSATRGFFLYRLKRAIFKNPKFFGVFCLFDNPPPGGGF